MTVDLIKLKSFLDSFGEKVVMWNSLARLVDDPNYTKEYLM